MTCVIIEITEGILLAIWMTYTIQNHLSRGMASKRDADK